MNSNCIDGQLQRWSITSAIAWVWTGGDWVVWSMRWPPADRLSALAKNEWREKRWRRGCKRRTRSTATSFQKTPKPSAGWWGHTHTHKAWSFYAGQHPRWRSSVQLRACIQSYIISSVKRAIEADLEPIDRAHKAGKVESIMYVWLISLAGSACFLMGKKLIMSSLRPAQFRIV